MSLRVLTVLGARPQFVKAAAVSQALQSVGDVHEDIVHTGQHFDHEMSEVFFEELGVPQPRWNLGVHGGGHGEMTAHMLARLEPLFQTERPDWVVVYGDTNSTLAGALAAAKLHVPVAHIEAGLRSFNRRMPEEVNRVVADSLSDLLLCPTRAAVRNLDREGVTRGVHHVGDVMYDVTLRVADVARAHSRVLERLGLERGAYVLATVHRAENTDEPERLATVLQYLRERAEESPVVLPLHPRTREAVSRHGLSLSGLAVCEPLGFLDMHRLLADAACVLTDSGGVQKEAYFHRVPCVTLREETEWVETVACGWNRLWHGPDYACRREIDEYGDGHAGERIVTLLREAAEVRTR